jgi:hypothetical protein
MALAIAFVITTGVRHFYGFATFSDNHLPSLSGLPICTIVSVSALSFLTLNGDY